MELRKTGDYSFEAIDENGEKVMDLVKYPPDIKIEGVDTEGSNNCNQNYGAPIPKAIAENFVGDKKNWENLADGEIVAVSFSKGPLQFLLGQNACEGLRFYYAMNENNKPTLVAVGIDKCGNDLGIGDPGSGKKGSMISDPRLWAPSLILEVGGGNAIEDFPKYPPPRN